MAKAAGQLAVTQPTVSEIIADLEHIFGLRLLDRGPHGVEPTIYGSALFGRTVAIFDELKQSSRDLEFLADPAVGELRIGYQESIASTLLVPAIRRFSKQYPNLVVQIDDVPSAPLQLSELRARKYDFTLQLLTRSLADENDLNVEVLYNDQLALGVSVSNPLARQRKIEFADLVDEPWILTQAATWARARVEEAFAAQGLRSPKPAVITMSAPMIMQLVSDSGYISAFPRAHLRAVASRFGLKELPLDLRDQPWPMVAVTLRHRTLSPIAERFLACAREVATSIKRNPTKNANV
jgi:DNA-binding transcriptional LysR family regulator